MSDASAVLLSRQYPFHPSASCRPPPPTFFWKCVKRKGFKSFVLKVCETKGVADVFLRKCVKLKRLGVIALQFVIFRLPGTSARTVQDEQILNLGSTVRGQP